MVRSGTPAPPVAARPVAARPVAARPVAAPPDAARFGVAPPGVWQEPLRDEGSFALDLLSHEPPLPGLEKIADFDRTYADDVVLTEAQLPLLASTAARFDRSLRTIGHGNFNLVSFDQLLSYSRRYSKIGRFSRRELDFLEQIFYTDAADYGFYGDKVTSELSAEILRREVKKIPGSGHFLLRGEPLEKYRKIRDDLGSTVILTSGIRSIVKQYQLFLAKSVESGGNLSQASRSLAPPGYSYHAVGDFDVGKIGFGLDNFTEAFATTDEYKKMIDLGYVEIRYTETNPFGVRHEPWHIKII